MFKKILFLYQECVPKKYRDRVPHIEERDGAQYYVMEGKKPRRLDVAEAVETDDDRQREFRSDRLGRARPRPAYGGHEARWC
jgi:hypothetical protein